MTLGHLAKRAGISKPVAYDHFGTRSGVLIELYRLIDRQQSNALCEALTRRERSFAEIAAMLAAAHVHCYADTSGEWHAIGAALAGSEEKEAAYQELLDGYVQLSAATLKPYCQLADAELEQRCRGLIGAGDALSAAMQLQRIRGDRGVCGPDPRRDARARIVEIVAPALAHGLSILRGMAN